MSSPSDRTKSYLYLYCPNLDYHQGFLFDGLHWSNLPNQSSVFNCFLHQASKQIAILNDSNPAKMTRQIWELPLTHLAKNQSVLHTFLWHLVIIVAKFDGFTTKTIA
ncbi:hypothetical protein B0189_00295 [Moraxella cuniculi]|nr:hypothetical protein B0189_00295 [Moraxella cuniculi]